MRIDIYSDREYPIKNFRLVEARKLRGLRQIDVADMAGVSRGVYPFYENMRHKPNQDKKERIAKALGTQVDAIFPKCIEDHYRKDNTKKSQDIYDNSIREDFNPEDIVDEEGIEKLLGREDLREEIRRLLMSLSCEQREVLKLRFGLDREGPLYFNEVAQILKETKNKIRLIEERAISKLRHSFKSRRLEKYTSLLH